MIKRLTFVLVIATLAASACSSGESTTAQSSSEPASESASASAGQSTSLAATHPAFVAAANHLCDQMIAAVAKNPPPPPSQAVGQALSANDLSAPGVSQFMV